jgi:hypothetical protein
MDSPQSRIAVTIEAATNNAPSGLDTVVRAPKAKPIHI